jgi:hypothetical protein
LLFGARVIFEESGSPFCKFVETSRLGPLSLYIGAGGDLLTAAQSLYVLLPHYPTCLGTFSARTVAGAAKLV